jgi:hypothetical protein
MKLSRTIQVAVAVTLLCAPPAAAQTGGQQTPSVPKPGPEQEVLKMEVGTWDAVVEFVTAPGAPPQTSKGVEVNTMGCGGMCLITDFKGEAMGSPFQGHGVMAWDGLKKKYTGMWMDSMSAAPALAESTYDTAGKKWSGTMEGPDMTGKVTKTRNASEWKDANTRVMTAWAPGPDGKEMQVMKITYTRKK